LWLSPRDLLVVAIDGTRTTVEHVALDDEERAKLDDLMRRVGELTAAPVEKPEEQEHSSARKSRGSRPFTGKPVFVVLRDEEVVRAELRRMSDAGTLAIPMGASCDARTERARRRPAGVVHRPIRRPLDGLEISQLSVAADLVVLSACNSAERATSARGMKELPGMTCWACGRPSTWPAHARSWAVCGRRSTASRRA
jgi:hypothetical protein